MKDPKVFFTENMDVTKNEQKILIALRSLKPFEDVTIKADQNGRADYFIVHRAWKEVLVDEETELLLANKREGIV